LFAVQGPRAVSLVCEAAHNPRLGDVPRFGCVWAEIGNVRVLLSRTGYTGEDGFEIFVLDSPLDEPKNAGIVWNQLLTTGKSSGLEPCGLGARDLLRLEAGYCLYGTDIDEMTNPFEARLGFVVKLDKEFIGRRKLQEEKEKGPKRMRVGLVMRNRVIPRHGFQIASEGEPVGEVTSGTLSPILNAGIAMGYAQRQILQDAQVEIRVRDRYEVAKVTKPPFYDTARYGYARKN
jgi:aminomethyltransferase